MFTRSTNSVNNNSIYFRSFKSPTWHLAKVSRLFVIACLLLTLFFDWFTPAEASSSDAAASTQASTSPTVAKTTNTQAIPTNAFANLPTTVPTAAKTAQVQQNLSKLGLRFEENDGQFDSQVKFKAQGGGYTLWLTSSGAVFDVLTGSTPVTPTTSSKVSPQQPVNPLCQQSSSGNNSKQPPKMLPTKGCPPPPTIDQHVAVRMTLDGANANLQAIGQNQLEGKSNYFIGKDSTKWHTNVPSFASVSYSSVYPGVDLTYYGNQSGQLEYDFKVAPNADPNAITLNFEGADGIEIASNGDLILHTGKTEIRQPAPEIYQETSGSNGVKSRTAVSGGYVSKGTNHVGFKLSGNYDRTKALVIDPLIYSTYLGGSDGNSSVGNSIAVDSSGNAYVTGYTESTNFPTSSGAFQTSCTAPQNYCYSMTFISKLNAIGNNLIYSTYLGGNDANNCEENNNLVDSSGNSIVVDSSGNAYVTGSTQSMNFPTTPGAFQASSCKASAFISKLNATGSALIYSTCLGGSDGKESSGNSIAIDSSGNAYVTGDTQSTNFPTTPGVFQPSCQIDYVDYICDNPAFISKLNATGNALIYSTYLGGEGGYDSGYSIIVDSNGNAYITGDTINQKFPTTPGAFQSSCIVQSSSNSCNTTTYISKLNATGSALVYSTYLDGSASSWGSSIAVDNNGNTYVIGETNSFDFPTTLGTFQPSCTSYIQNGQNYCYKTAYISKLNATGSALVYSTYLDGNDGNESYGNSIVVDNSNNVYVIGYTYSTNFPTTLGAFQSSCTVQVVNGQKVCNSSMAFISKMNVTGNVLIYSTYLGGSYGNYNSGNSIAVDSSGNAYVTGYTGSANFPTTSGAFQSSCTFQIGNNYCNSYMVFISKLSPIAQATNYHLQFDTQPVGSSAGTPFSTQPIVSVRDENGQLATTYSGTVNIAILPGSGDANANLVGQSSMPVSQGIANFSFNDLTIDTSGSYILQANSDNATPANSNLIGIEDIPIYYDNPDFTAWDQDDLYTKNNGNITSSGSNSLTVNFNMNRYYGLVNSNNILIDQDSSYSQADRNRNAALHGSSATLYLWFPAVSTQFQLYTLSIATNDTSDSVNVNVVPGVAQLLAVPIQLKDLRFPNICTGDYSNVSDYNCLRNPDKANGYICTDSNNNCGGSADYPSNYQSYAQKQPERLQSVLNTIIIKNLSANTNPLITDAYIYLNGVRPVLLMEGIDPSGNKVKDTTSGWGDIPKTTDPYDTEGLLSAAARQTNWINILSSAGVPSWNPPRNGALSIDDQVQFVTDGYNVLSSAYGVKKINIIGHSMGGIVTRRWIAAEGNGNKVDSYITLDSPHGGVYGANLIPGDGSAAAHDLSPDKLRTFNQANNLSKFSGTLRSYLYTVVAKELVCNGFFTRNCNYDYANDDGLIEWPSGLGTAYAHDSNTDETKQDPNLPANYSTVGASVCNHTITRYEVTWPGAVNPVCHGAVMFDPTVSAWITTNTNIINYNLNYYPHPSFAKLNNGCATLNNIISCKSTQSVAVVTTLPTNSKAKTKDTSIPFTTTTPNETILQATGQVSASSNITFDLPIDVISNLNIEIGLDEGTASLNILDSSGNNLFPAISEPSLIYTSTLPAGGYKLVLNTSTLTTTTNYSLKVLANSNLQLKTLVAINPANSGLNSKVEAILASNNIPAIGAIVTATVSVIDPVSNTFTNTTVSLQDDGQTSQDGDTSANDGIYTAYLPSNLTTQLLEIRVFANGNFNSAEFLREDSISTQAKSGELYFTGPYSWQSNILTNTNFIGTANFNAGVNVQQSGNFIVSAVLADSSGETVANGSATLSLNAGNNTIAIPFDMSGVWQSQLDGPYHISQLSAQYVGPNSVNNSDSLDDTSSLPPLNLTLSQLNQPLVLLSGAAISDTPLNPDSKGKYQTLQVTVPLDVAVSNVYSYSAVLRTQNGMPAGAVSGQVNLQAGSNTPLQLNFPGSSIYASGQNGPYQVESLIVEDVTTGQVLLFVDNVGQTSNYQYTQFSGPSYTYYLPFLANSAGGYTSYLAFQNVGSAAANFTLQFYNTSGAIVGTPTLQGTCAALAANAECLPSNPFTSGSAGSGVIVSDQPLNVIVAEGTPYGGSAYAVSNGGSNNLVAPLILKGAYGDFNTRLTIFNGGSSAASVGVTFYDQYGNVQTSANQSQAVAANTTWTLDQASSNLPAGFNGWAQISAPAGSQLVAQVLEQSQSRKFVAIANAQPSSKAATTLYAPAIFKGAFGFVTGANIVNPNSNPVSVTVTYYDDSGKAYPAPAFTLNANSITSIYQSANGGNGLPTNPTLLSGFSGAAIITSTGGNLLMVVNESGGVSASGTSLSGVYAAASSGGGTVGLPVMANGGYGYVTGATILNTSSNSVNGTIQYYNTDGSKQGNSHQFTIGPNASQLVYQGDAAQGLSNNFYGTAIITETGVGQDLIATTNAESGLFYTYTEPNN